MRAAAPAVPPVARRFVTAWHRIECWIAVAAFGFIALALILDVAGRELLTPLFQMLGIKGAAGIYGSQKMSIYALVVASFVGIGIATATGSHLVPRVGFGWVPQAWGPHMNRLADALSGLFMCGVAYFGWVFVNSTFNAGLRAQAFDLPIWPFQVAIPFGFASAAVRYFAFAWWPALRPLPPEFQE